MEIHEVCFAWQCFSWLGQMLCSICSPISFFDWYVPKTMTLHAQIMFYYQFSKIGMLYCPPLVGCLSEVLAWSTRLAAQWALYRTMDLIACLSWGVDRHNASELTDRLNSPNVKGHRSNGSHMSGNNGNDQLTEIKEMYMDKVFSQLYIVKMGIPRNFAFAYSSNTLSVIHLTRKKRLPAW